LTTAGRIRKMRGLSIMNDGSPTPDAALAASLPVTPTFPWPSVALLLGATSIIVGVIWDISWHSTVGRDTFWTSAHMAIYVGGVAGGVAGGWAALRATFGGSGPARAASIGVWGARAPLGAWVAIWGALAMITSAPLDDWWHNAYGLDVEILSPPHCVLAAGMFGIALGALLSIVSWQNRLPEGSRARGGFLSAWAVGMILAMAATFHSEYSYPNRQHGSLFYQVSCASYPLYLAATARAVKCPWPATTSAAVYMGIVILMGWILPLFPAEPLLAPIRNPHNHMVPPSFPLVLVAPALAIDLLCRRRPSRSAGWMGLASRVALAVVAGAGFLAVLLAVQWPFSKFLLGPGADSRLFFGAQFFAYFNEPGEWMRSFWRTGPGGQPDSFTGQGLALSFVLSVLSAWAGIATGDWLSRVKR
jgi:hypothetical protein